MIKRIIIEVDGGVVQTVYGDKMPEGIELDIIIRDWDNINQGDDDPLNEEDLKDINDMINYW